MDALERRRALSELENTMWSFLGLALLAAEPNGLMVDGQRQPLPAPFDRHSTNQESETTAKERSRTNSTNNDQESDHYNGPKRQASW